MDKEQETKGASGSQWVVPFSIIIAGALVGAGIYFSDKPLGRQIDYGAAANNSISEINVNPVTEKDHILGNPNAPVVLVEFSDTECPFCKTYHFTLKRLIDEYGASGKFAWVYRHFPIKELHTKATKEAEATECAYDQGGDAKFWAFLNEIFDRTPSNDGLDPSELQKIAQALKLDIGDFNKCLDGGKFSSKVQAQYQDGVRAGGRGTPYSVLITKDGQKVSLIGAQEYDILKAIIETALENQNIK